MVQPALQIADLFLSRLANLIFSSYPHATPDHLYMARMEVTSTKVPLHTRNPRSTGDLYAVRKSAPMMLACQLGPTSSGYAAIKVELNKDVILVNK